jgi:pyridoxamine 5'-phosphate oxidase
MATLADLRREYMQAGLDESDAQGDAMRQFEQWFDQALSAGVDEPNAMTLATVGPEGRPSARIVLLKGFDARGFTFFTNYRSRKGRELAQNPHAALVFFWPALERQVRIEGDVAPVTRQESELYFHTRPIGSRLGAWASNQSEVIESRQVIEQRHAELMARYATQTVPLPEYWGGYRLTPRTLEFWQGRLSRLHDRLLYTIQPDGAWLRQRLSP